MEFIVLAGSVGGLDQKPHFVHEKQSKRMCDVDSHEKGSNALCYSLPQHPYLLLLPMICACNTETQTLLSKRQTKPYDPYLSS